MLITYILWTVGIVKIHFADYKTFALEINVMYVVTAMGCKQRFRDKKMPTQMLHTCLSESLLRVCFRAIKENMISF